MTTRPILLHVGYHKTATTWLQNSVFRPEHGFPQVMTHPQVFEHIVTPHGLAYDAQAVRDLVAPRLGAGGGVDVISLESLSGNPFYGGRESDDYAQRLKAAFPQARILLSIREQMAIIASVYMQYLLRGGTAPARAFFEGAQVGGYMGFDPVHFEYDRLVGLYQDLYGAENVMVLPLEEIARDQAQAVARMAAFSDNTQIAPWETRPSRGVSYPEAAVPLLRRVNHLRPGPANPHPVADLGGLSRLAYRVIGGGLRRLGKGRARPVTMLAREMFKGRFTESNQRLQAMLAHPADLSRYDGIKPD